MNYYTITVSRDGFHYFTTAGEIGGGIIDLDHAIDVYNDLHDAYPRSQGFNVVLTKWNSATGRTISDLNCKMAKVAS